MTARPDAATYFGGRTALYDSRYEAQNADGHALRARLAVVLERSARGRASSSTQAWAPAVSVPSSQNAAGP